MSHDMYTKTKQRWTIFIPIILLIIVTFFIELRSEQGFSTIGIWTIVLALTTMYYARSTHKILELQEKSEILKSFQQIRLDIDADILQYKDNLFMLRGINCTFENISNGIAYDCELDVFHGDSIVNIHEAGQVLIKYNLGILASKVTYEKNLEFHNSPKFTNEIMLRINLTYKNPLKIKNSIHYLLTVKKYNNDEPVTNVSILDVNNGILQPDFAAIKKKSVDML